MALKLGITITATDKASKEIEKVKSSVSSIGSASEVAQSKVSKFFNTAIKLAGAYLALETGKKIANSFLGVAKSFENLTISLKTVTGSMYAARESMKWITDFTAKTPYQLNEVAEAFRKLTAYGMDARKYLKTLGDTASAMGKSLNDAVEMFTDAAQGEFERLKEFGVRASQTANEVTFTWQEHGKQMKMIVSKTQSDITRALGEIFQRFKGGMEEQSKTLTGILSNIRDQWTLFRKDVMDSGVFNYIKAGAQTVLDSILKLKKQGKLHEYAKTIAESFISGFKTIAKGVLWVKKIFLGWKGVFIGLKKAWASTEEFISKGIQKISEWIANYFKFIAKIYGFLGWKSMKESSEYYAQYFRNASKIWGEVSKDFAKENKILEKEILGVGKEIEETDKKFKKFFKNIEENFRLAKIQEEADAWAESFKNLSNNAKKAGESIKNTTDIIDNFKKKQKELQDLVTEVKAKLGFDELGRSYFDQLVKDTEAWGESFKNLKQEVIKAEFPEYFEKVEGKVEDLTKKTKESFTSLGDEIKNIWKHAFENIQDIFADWFRHFKVDLSSIVDLFKNTISQMVGAWMAGWVRMSMAGFIPAIAGGTAGVGGTSGIGGMGLNFLSGLKSLYGFEKTLFEGGLGNTKIWNILGAKTGIVDFTGKGGLLSSSTWTTLGNIAGNAMFGAFIGGLYSKIFHTGSGSTIGGALGSIAGGLFSSTLGPLGVIGGGLLGSIVGGLFGGKKKKLKIRVGAKDVDISYVPGKGFSYPEMEYFDSWYTKYAKQGEFYAMEQHVKKSTMEKVVQAGNEIIKNVLGGFDQTFQTLLDFVDDNTKKFVKQSLQKIHVNLNFDVAGKAKKVDEYLKEFGNNLSIKLYNQYKSVFETLLSKSKETLLSDYGDVINKYLDKGILSDINKFFDSLGVNLRNVSSLEDLEKVLKEINSDVQLLQNLNNHLKSIKEILGSFDEVINNSTLSNLEINIDNINKKYEEQAKILEDLGVNVNQTSLSLSNAIEIWQLSNSTLENIRQTYYRLTTSKTQQIEDEWKRQLVRLAQTGLESIKSGLKDVAPNLTDQDIAKAYQMWLQGSLNFQQLSQQVGRDLSWVEKIFKEYHEAEQKVSVIIQKQISELTKTKTSYHYTTSRYTRPQQTIKEVSDNALDKIIDLFKTIKEQTEKLISDIKYSFLKPTEALKFAENQYNKLKKQLFSFSLADIKAHPEQFKALYEKYQEAARNELKYIEAVYKSSPTAIEKKQQIISDLTKIDNFALKVIGNPKNDTLKIDTITKEQADKIINLLEKILNKDTDINVKAEVLLDGMKINNYLNRLRRLTA